jgi:DNA-binding MarR family transcriptional regulator
MRGKNQPEKNLPEFDCACATIRRAARLVTQLYSHEMGDALDPAQFGLLTILHRKPGSGQTPLGHALGLDKTTLSRNLSLLKRNGWIEPVMTAEDRRERGYRLTRSGEERLAAARPGWKRAQEKLRSAMTKPEWEGMLKVFNRVAGAAQGIRTAGARTGTAHGG